MYQGFSKRGKEQGVDERIRTLCYEDVEREGGLKKVSLLDLKDIQWTG